MTDFQGDRTSGKEFINFWDYVIEKGLMNEYTARSLGSASSAILSVEDNWEEINITTIDPGEFITRFQNIHSREYSPRTLIVYAQRFKRALRQYLSYIENPSGWKPPKAKRTSSNKVPAKEKETPVTNIQSGYTASSLSSFSDPNLKMISHQFPLRDNCVIQLRLPLDLRESDIERIINFLKVLVVPSVNSEV